MTVEVTNNVTVSVSFLSPKSYLQEYICELQYAPGKWRPEVFLLDKNTQPGDTLVINHSFIKVVDRLNKPQ